MQPLNNKIYLLFESDLGILFQNYANGGLLKNVEETGADLPFDLIDLALSEDFDDIDWL